MVMLVISIMTMERHCILHIHLQSLWYKPVFGVSIEAIISGVSLVSGDFQFFAKNCYQWSVALLYCDYHFKPYTGSGILYYNYIKHTIGLELIG